MTDDQAPPRGDNLLPFTKTTMDRPLDHIAQYLRARAIPTDEQYLAENGIEIAGALRLSEALGRKRPFPSHVSGLIFHFPGTEHLSARLISDDPNYKGPRNRKGAPFHAYCPRATDWDNLKGVLVLCESPLKALTWAAVGFSALAAGGVDTIWQNGKREWCQGFPHAAIESGDVAEVWIAFDSDVDSNPNVALAVGRLAWALQNRHPDVNVKLHKLPPPPESFPKKSWGCDDFRAHLRNDETFLSWCNDPSAREEPPKDKLTIQREELNDQYVFCRAESKVIEIDSGFSWSGTEFKNSVEASRVVHTEAKSIKVAAAWMGWEGRREVQERRYRPAEGKVYEEYYNTWAPGPLSPRAGDVSPWLKVLKDSVPDTQVRELMLQCMAYQVQNRGTRLQKVLYFVGPDTGTGKSTQCEIMKEILGVNNTGWIGKKDIQDGFNSAWALKELVVLDDAPRLRGETWPMIKQQVTSDQVTVNQKYREQVSSDNYAVFYITSNTTDVLPIEPDERRVLMIHFDPRVLHRDADDPYWKEFHDWLGLTGRERHKEGVEMVYQYLLDYDLSDFDPHFHPPNTEMKQIAAESRMSDEETFAQSFARQPEEYVPDGRKVVTGHELARLFEYFAGDDTGFGGTNQTQLLKRLSSHGRLRRMFEERVKVGEKMTTIYWVPGREDSFVSASTDMARKKKARDNIRGHKITLK